MCAKPAVNSRWERKLNIFTGAEGYEKEDNNHSRYEPTDYAVLERLAQSRLISRDDVLVDYGCGRGRVGFFMNHALGCRTIGVEYNAALYEDARANLARYTGRGTGSVSFVCESAENYIVEKADCFYFFNPFSLRILQGVIRRILESYYENPRQMRLFFYYALDDYRGYLMTETALQFLAEIDCRDLFHNANEREKILVFQIS